MAEYATLTARMVLTEGNQERAWSASHSDKLVLESNTFQLLVATNKSTKLGLYSMGTNSGPKAIFVESDYPIYVRWNTTSGVGWRVRGGGFIMGVVDGMTSLRIENASNTNVATATVAVYLLTAT